MLFIHIFIIYLCLLKNAPRSSDIVASNNMTVNRILIRKIVQEIGII
jgi:hypothetical protein